MKEDLLKCGYPELLVQDAIEKFKNSDSENLRTLTEKKAEQENICFVHTFNPNNIEMKGIIKKSMPMLYSSHKMKSIIENTKIINAQRQSPNLFRLLTNSKYCSESLEAKVIKCNSKRCKLCDIIIEDSEVTLP